MSKTISISDDVFAFMFENIARTAMSEQGIRSANLASFTPDPSDVTRLAEASIRHGVAVFSLENVASRIPRAVAH